MSIRVKEIFGPTIQGEGFYTGYPATFVRLSGCNIWDGSEETKAKSACPYCDTDFVGGEEITEQQILNNIQSLGDVPLIVITGGEPLLQDIKGLCSLLLDSGYLVQIETNGTIHQGDLNPAVHIALSPKVKRKAIKLTKVDTIKLLHPHPNKDIVAENFDDIPGVQWKSLQPIENDRWYLNIRETAQEAKRLAAAGFNNWRVGLQIHKVLGEE